MWKGARISRNGLTAMGFIISLNRDNHVVLHPDMERLIRRGLDHFDSDKPEISKRVAYFSLLRWLIAASSKLRDYETAKAQIRKEMREHYGYSRQVILQCQHCHLVQCMLRALERVHE